MSRLQQVLLGFIAASSLLAFVLPYATSTDTAESIRLFGSIKVMLLVVVFFLVAASIWRMHSLSTAQRCVLATIASLLGAFVLLGELDQSDSVWLFGGGFFAVMVSAWLLGWLAVEFLTECEPKAGYRQLLWSLAIPLFFGVWLLLLWEISVRALQVPAVLLPAPSDIGTRFAASLDVLWVDFNQTFVKSVLSGYVMGCGSGFVVAVLIDRSPFLQRGLLPLANLASALPIVGVAPIMVMWFGFDWQSKAAVVVIMTFFPMLVNTVEGLAASSAMQRDLMHSYGASYWQSLFKLRLPAAMPLMFNALKINSTLALIGAIVAEFFGTPIVGMGFRISTEVGRMNLDMVWAEIAVAAIAGSLFYWVVSLVERWVAHWHPSIRRS